MKAGRDKVRAGKSPGQTYCRARKGLSMSLDSNSACEEGSFFILKRHGYLRTDLPHGLGMAPRSHPYWNLLLSPATNMAASSDTLTKAEILLHGLSFISAKVGLAGLHPRPFRHDSSQSRANPDSRWQRGDRKSFLRPGARNSFLTN